MSSFSTKMLLKRNDGSDPFLRQDFVDNWNKIDAAPGVYICDSATRPTWSSSQAGRSIFETDTQRLVLWSGTAWVEPLVAPVVYNVNTVPNASVAHGATATYTLGTVTLKRPATLTVIYQATVGNVDTVSQNVTITPWVDSASALAGQIGFVGWVGANNNAGGTSYHTTPVLGTLAGAAIGAHTIGLRFLVATSASATTAVVVQRITATVLITAPSSS